MSSRFTYAVAMQRLTFEMLTLKLRNPFHLSYGTSETRNSFWIRLADDEGWGEATIPPYYRVDQSAMTGYWDAVARDERAFPENVEEVDGWISASSEYLRAGVPAPARCGVELALFDRLGK